MKAAAHRFERLGAALVDLHVAAGDDVLHVGRASVALSLCLACGLTHAWQERDGETPARVAVGLDLESLTVVRSLPPCEVRDA